MKAKFLQQGGVAPQDGGAAPTPQPNQASAEQQIAQMAAQIVEQLGPEAATLLAQAIAELVQQAPTNQQPQFARQGGKLVKRK